MTRVFLCLAVVFASACQRGSRPPIGPINVDAFEGGEVVSMTPENLRERVVAQLNGARFELLKGAAPEGVHPWKVTVAAGLAEPDPESKSLDVQVVLGFDARGADGFETRAHDRRPLPSSDVEGIQEALRLALDQALSRAAREAHASIDLAPGNDEVLVGKLKDADEAVREAALRLLVQRRNVSALDPLLEWLKADDLARVRQAVGLLVELRAPGAVNALIAAAERRGPVVQREVLFAVGSIGGEDAEAYLDLVASGHDDPAWRALAEQLLSELRARKRLQKEHP